MAKIWDNKFQILGLTVFTFLLLVTNLNNAIAQNTLKDHAVVELFTSQGCSSCPPADAYLGVLAKRKDVTALTFNVDYWDYLGWKDTLGSRQYSQRQRSYARMRGDGEVYTPQMVINGADHAVGSRRTSVNSAIDAAKRTFGNYSVPLSLSKDKTKLMVTAGEANEGSTIKSGTIWIACVKKAITVPIGRGENTGKTITYYNVVRQLVPVGMWSGKTKTLDLPIKEFRGDKPDMFYALLQSGRSGRIIGVAQLGNS